MTEVYVLHASRADFPGLLEERRGDGWEVVHLNSFTVLAGAGGAYSGDAVYTAILKKEFDDPREE